MAINLEDMLKRLGWNDGFQIPIANDENKELEKELAKLTLKKNKVTATRDNIAGRLEALKENFKYVEQENDQTEKLISAHRQQYEVIKNAYHTSKAEDENIKHATKKIDKELKEALNMEESKKDELNKNVVKAEQLKSEMDWDAEALKAWEEALKRRDEDTEVLRKFSKEDVMIYNELEAKRQRLQTEHTAIKDIMKRVANEVASYEFVIERSGKVMKQQMAEREALINQWKDTVKMLQQRDLDIVHAQEAIEVIHERMAKQEEKLREENHFLEDQRRVNHEVELEIQQLSAVISRSRRDFGEITQIVLLLNGQNHTMKRQVVIAAQQLENTRMKAKMLSETLSIREQAIERGNTEVGELKMKKQEMEESAMSSSERLKKIEKMIDYEEKIYSIILADTEKMNNSVYRAEKVLKDQKEILKSIMLELNNINFNCGQLRKHISNYQKELNKMKEVVYDMEFRIDESERRLCVLSEKQNLTEDDRSEELAKKIKQMEDNLAEQKDVQHVLQTQVDRIQEEMHRLANFIAQDKEQALYLEKKCENYMMLYENGKKQINAAKQATQEKQVEENIMLLRLNQIEKEKKREEKQIFSLERLRLNLEQAVKERHLEINTTKTIIQAKRRNMDEERGRLKADIALRKVKIEQIQKKYHIALTTLGKDEEGQPLSVAHFRVKKAQEKFMLQQQGDELDKKIRTAEKEIIAMENTLKLVNVSNAQFKNSLATVKEEDKEVKEMNDIENSSKILSEQLKELKRQLGEGEEELKAFADRLEEGKQSNENYRDVVRKMEGDIEQVRGQEAEKTKMLKRADCAIKRAMRKIREDTDLSKYLRDFEIRQLQDVNRQVVQALYNLALDFKEMAPQINRYTLEYRVKLPPSRRTPTSQSSLSTLSNCTSSRVVSTSTYEVDTPKSVTTVNLSFNL